MTARPPGPASQRRDTRPLPGHGTYGGLARTRSNRPWGGLSVTSALRTRTGSLCNRALSHVAASARRDTSTAVTSVAPDRTAATASAPVPVPPSNRVSPDPNVSPESASTNRSGSSGGRYTPGGRSSNRRLFVSRPGTGYLLVARGAGPVHGRPHRTDDRALGRRGRHDLPGLERAVSRLGGLLSAGEPPPHLLEHGMRQQATSNTDHYAQRPIQRLHRTAFSLQLPREQT